MTYFNILLIKCKDILDLNIQATDGRPYTHFSWFQLLNAKSAAPPYGIYISGSPKSVSFLGKGERNEVFIINFAEIYSNTEFLST